MAWRYKRKWLNHNDVTGISDYEDCPLSILRSFSEWLDVKLFPTKRSMKSVHHTYSLAHQYPSPLLVSRARWFDFSWLYTIASSPRQGQNSAALPYKETATRGRPSVAQRGSRRVGDGESLCTGRTSFGGTGARYRTPSRSDRDNTAVTIAVAEGNSTWMFSQPCCQRIRSGSG